MIGKIFLKSLQELDAYVEAANWCNANNAHIEEREDYYEVVANPEPSLSEIKAAKIAELKALRDAKELEPVLVGNDSFDFDEKSYNRITAAIYTLEIVGGKIPWATADNSVVDVAAKDLKNVIATAAARSNKLHEQYRTLKEAVQAAETKDAIDAIVWEEEEDGFFL